MNEKELRLDTMYKTYQLTEGVKCMAPKDPTSNFDGRWYDESGHGYTPDEIEAMDLTQDMTFYSSLMDE